jgi:GTP-binding protein Era
LAEPVHRCGVVAILGLPNAGKSTLLNRILGEKLAIVTPKPQTTRSRLLGVLTLPGAQLLLVDTPGLHHGSSALHRAMQEAAEAALADCDLALVLVDVGRGWEPPHDALLERLGALRKPFLLVETQADRAPGGAPLPPAALERAAGRLRVSALRGEGVGALVTAILARLPEAPPLYPEDELTDRPLRFLAAERVREAAFQVLGQELPYQLGVEIRAFDESRPDLARIAADLLVERASQKRIVVGAGGSRIKEIGVRARREIEALVGHQVHLELWVKVEPHWTRSRPRVEELGYR